MILALLLLACAPDPGPLYVNTCDSVSCPQADTVRRYNGAQLRTVDCVWNDVDGASMRVEFEAWYGECFEVSDEHVWGDE